MATPQDRKDKLVWEALEAPGAGPKQALQLINRRVKKGEKYDYLLALKAHVLTMLPPTDGASNPSAEALAICTQLVTRNTLPKPSETLLLLERCFIVLGRREEVGKLYEKVYQAKVSAPGRTGGADEDGLKDWLKACVRAGDWSGAQKAAMGLQKQFPKKREYYFWAITACLSLHNSRRQENTLFGTLAERMIVKAAEDASSGESHKPARAIKTNQELHLLLDTLSSLKKTDESIRWLTSDTLGYQSTFVKGEEWSFWSRLANEYRENHRWSDLWRLCTEVLEKEAKRHDNGALIESDSTPEMGLVDWREDWKVWENLIESAFNEGKATGNGDLMAEAWSIIKKHIEKTRPHRSVLLAELAFAAALMQSDPRNSTVEGAPNLLEASKRYYKRMSTKVCCYDDLRPFVAQLKDTDLNAFQSFLTESILKPECSVDPKDGNEVVNSVASTINGLKLQHLPRTTSDSANKDIDSFLGSCLRTYAVSLPLGGDLMSTDNQYGDDALLLAVQTVLQLYCSHSSQILNHYLVTCAILLEHLLQSSKRNYSALLILVRVYILLGAPSLALLAYQRLSIKQIQNDTLAHHVLSRISTILPFASPTAPIATPSDDNPDVGTHTPANPTDSLEMLRIGLKIYNSGDRQMPRMITQAIENGNYGQIRSFLEFGRRLEVSICKRLFEVERRRVKRLRGVNDSVGAGWDDILRIETEDNRDWKTVGEGDWEAKSRLQPVIGPTWVKAFVLADAILLPLTSWSQSGGAETSDQSSSKASSSKQKQQPPQPQQEVSSTPDLVSQLSTILTTSSESFTAQEHKILEFFVKLGQMEAEIRQSKSGSKVKTLISEISTEMKKRDDESIEHGLEILGLSGDSKEERWVQLHSSFLLLETCKSAVTLHDFLLNSAAAKSLKPPISRPSLASLKQEAQALAKSVQKTAADRSRAAREVTEDDIDAIMVSKEADDRLSSVKSYIKDKVGRQKVEEIMDKIGKSQAEAWAAVGKVKI